MKRADRVGIGPVKHVAAVAPDTDEADVFQDAQVLGDGRLLDAEGVGDLVDGAFLKDEVVQDVATAGFGDSVESVGGSGGARHEMNIFPYRNICQALFLSGDFSRFCRCEMDSQTGTAVLCPYRIGRMRCAAKRWWRDATCLCY